MIEKWAAFAGESVYRAGHGADLNYDSATANTYLKHMREDQMLQAILRFGVSRTRAAIHHWYQSFAEHYDQNFTAEPDRVAVDEKQIQLENEQKVWLYAAIDADSKVVRGAQLSQDRGTEPATTFLRKLKEEHRVGDAEFLVDGMGYLTALAKTDLLGDLNYSERNIIEKLFQTYTMRIGRFHETWNGGQPSAERWLTAYSAYYNHLRSHQALENQPPIEALEQEGSI